MDLITGRTGTDHVLARHDAIIHQTLFGAGDFVLKTGYYNDSGLALTQIDGNHIKIDTGHLIMQGRLCEQKESESIEITACASSNLKKKVVIVAEYNIDALGIESVSLVSIEGSTSSNMYIEPVIPYEKGIIDSGETHQMPLYAVYMDGFSLKHDDNDELVYDALFSDSILDTTPIQSALNYAEDTASNVQSILSTLSANVYDYMSELMEGISHGIKGQWKSVVNVTDASSAVAVTMSQDYVYTLSDIVDVYLNGLRLTSGEYSAAGSSNVINVTLTATTFTGQMEVVATKLSEEV